MTSKTQKSGFGKMAATGPVRGELNDPEVTENEEEICLLPLGIQITSYLQYLIARDVAMWPPDRPCSLTRDEARAFAWFLHDSLPKGFRTPMSKRPRGGGWHGRVA